MFVKRVSSKNLEGFVLTDSNHISNCKVPIAKLYKALDLWSPKDRVPTPLKEEATYSVSIAGWNYDGIEEDWQGNPLDLHVYYMGNNLVTGPEVLWEPYVEYLYRKNFLTNYYKPNALHRVAYLDGLAHHTGPLATQGHASSGAFDGYQLMQSMKS